MMNPGHQWKVHTTWAVVLSIKPTPFRAKLAGQSVGTKVAPGRKEGFVTGITPHFIKHHTY